MATLRLQRPFPILSCHQPPPEPQTVLAISGPTRLSGHVTISGSKNASLPILAATLCCSGTSRLIGIPDLSDIRTMASVLRSVGAGVEGFGGNGEMSVDADGVGSVEPCGDAIRRIRGGFLVIGPLLGRFGEAVVALPGGCDIGARPVDLYIRGLRALGAVIELRDGKVHAHAANGRGLVGGCFRLDYPSVGATEALMMAASLADGSTVLSNAAKEPEVTDLAHFLIDCGAYIEGAGSDTILIKGSRQLHGSEYTICPDRIEAGTFLVAATITRSCISMSPVVPSHLSDIITKLSASGCKITQLTRDMLEVCAVPVKSGGELKGFDVRTSPYPGFPTDLQPQIMALLTTCSGLSRVEESVFEKRLGHVRELEKLGARIEVSGSTALVYGKQKGRVLRGSRVVAGDLRGGAALVLAGLAAEGKSEVSCAAHIYRGYENFDKKLQLLGADVKILNSVSEL